MYKIIFGAVLFLTFCSKLCVKCSENSNDEEDSFVPTHEWQVVKKGQKIPKGLHVRVNFESGITEAKLLDENTTEETKAVVQVPDAENSNTKNPAHFKLSQEELKEALKNIKSEEIKEEKTQKFRSYEELKDDLSELNISPKTDFELLKELVSLHKKLQKSNENEELMISIIEDLEYLVHQIDNANDFVTLNGFVDIIYPNLNSTSVDIKSGTLKLFGSSVQNNAKVQIHALETGAVGILLKALVLNSNHEIKNRAIYALSSLMRRFPLAQTQFLDSAGLNVFEELLQKSNNIKLLLKIVTLIHDLILEHNDALSDTNNNLEKIKQYNAVNLKRKLKDQNWCPYLVTLLGNIIKVDVSDHDAVEKILNTIISSDVCNILDNLQLQTLVSHLQSYYTDIIQVDDDKYFQQLLDLCNSLVRPLKHKSEL